MAANSLSLQQKSPRICPFNRLPCAYPCVNLVQARMSASMSNESVCQELGISRSTWWRYRRGHQRPCRAVCLVLHILTGWLPYTGWQDCFIDLREQRLYLHNYRFGLDMADLRAYWWKMQLIPALERQLRDLRAQIHENDQRSHYA